MAIISTPCSVIIRALNEERHIGRLLRGIQQRNVEAQLIPVDSGSTDATVAIAGQFGCQIVKITSGKFTFGRALNLGCAAAKHELLVMASAHIYPLHRSWLENSLLPFSCREVGVIYGRQVGCEQTKYSERHIFAKWFPTESVVKQSIPFCNNANAAVRREVWSKLKYNESSTVLEDLDFA